MSRQWTALGLETVPVQDGTAFTMLSRWSGERFGTTISLDVHMGHPLGRMCKIRR